MKPKNLKSNKARTSSFSTTKKVILFNKPFGVICQFSPEPPHQNLSEFIPIKEVYPAGRLDTDSEGLLILTNDGKLQNFISSPTFNKQKTYLVQVEGIPQETDLDKLRVGVKISDYTTKTAEIKIIDEPAWLWERNPPIRERKNIPTTWLEIKISEGKNRQVRKMTAAIGYPTLRLVREKIGNISVQDIALGEYKEVAYNDFTKKF